MDNWILVGRISDLLGITGVLVSVLTLVRVWNIRKAISNQGLFNALHQMVEETTKLPTSKATLTKSNIEKVYNIIVTLESLVISSWHPKHKNARKIIKQIKEQLNGSKNSEAIVNGMRLLKDQIFKFD